MAGLRYEHRWIPREGASETLLLLHGTGGNENDLLALGDALAPRAHLLSPRGNVLENGMPRFFRRIAEGVLDVDDLKRRAEDLADFVVAAAKLYGFDASRVTAVGYSNGANVALGILFERPGTLRRAVLMRAMLAYEPPPQPGALAGTRVLLLGGERDPYSRAPVTEDLGRVLSKRGADVTARYVRAGHEIGGDDVVQARAWLASGPE